VAERQAAKVSADDLVRRMAVAKYVHVTWLWACADADMCAQAPRAIDARAGGDSRTLGARKGARRGADGCTGVVSLGPSAGLLDMRAYLLHVLRWRGKHKFQAYELGL
jgi:hypothetical protein